MNFVVSRRARRLRITVKPGGEVVVTMPHRLPVEAAHLFVHRKNEWIARAVSKMKRFSKPLLGQGTVKEYRARRGEALQFVRQRIAHFNALYGFSYRKISIRNQKTRWGSCSRKGNLSFNYRVLLLPSHLADYIIFHELCHLQEFNHSKRFWDLVNRAVPDARSLRAQLKNGV